MKLILNYDGWCRRIDLNFRAEYPYISTRIFKISNYEYHLYAIGLAEDFSHIEKIFDNKIRYITTPIKLVAKIPEKYEYELTSIADENIPSNFEGIPFTLDQMLVHIASIHSNVMFSQIREDHENSRIIIELALNSKQHDLDNVEKTTSQLKSPYSFQVIIGNTEAKKIIMHDEVFSIAPSQYKKDLNCNFLERDESLWFENIDKIYSGEFKKSELYFIEKNKSSCLVNFSIFKNSNLRNHLLLYDIVYCVLPFSENINNFFEDQKISRFEFLTLLKRGRIKILNIQPEIRLDYGLLNEAYSENPSSVISRRALSALSAIDLVELNQSYIFSDPELEKHILPLLKQISELTAINLDLISNFILWPKKALRNSLDTLNQSGPIGIAQYGVNNTITRLLPSKNKQSYDFEFTVNSNQIHLAHALDATYFPFYTENAEYSDHPYALMMGHLLNFYKKYSYQTLSQCYDMNEMKMITNPSLSLISIFDINEYIPILEFENELSSGTTRKYMQSLFSELSTLDQTDRNERIHQYNIELEKALKNKNKIRHGLDLGLDALGMAVPFLSTIKKALTYQIKRTKSNGSAIQVTFDFIEDKALRGNMKQRQISLLTKINRVARLKRSLK